MSVITFVYRFLDFPKIYSFSQKLLAPGSEFLLQKEYAISFAGSKGLVHDIGCGPSLDTPMPNGIIVGGDINPRYVRKYAMLDKSEKTSKKKRYRGHSQSAHFGVVCTADYLPFYDSTFNETRCSGLLHHLPTESALLTIKEMLRCTRPFGRVIIFDNVWPKKPICRPLAWLTRRYDRGQGVRTEDQLLNLAYAAYHGNWQHRRFTYTFTGLEGIFLTIERQEIY
jgi:SAM-dependent methyltransferase